MRELSTLAKRLERWRNIPRQGLRWSTVESTLKTLGCTIDKVSGGSHFQISHDTLVGEQGYGELGEFTVAVKSGRTLKAVYVVQVVEAIDIILAKGEDASEES